MKPIKKVTVWCVPGQPGRKERWDMEVLFTHDLARRFTNVHVEVESSSPERGMDFVRIVVVHRHYQATDKK